MAYFTVTESAGKTIMTHEETTIPATTPNPRAWRPMSKRVFQALTAPNLILPVSIVIVGVPAYDVPRMFVGFWLVVPIFFVR